jgi:hypothetical protein
MVNAAFHPMRFSLNNSALFALAVLAFLLVPTRLPAAPPTLTSEVVPHLVKAGDTFQVSIKLVSSENIQITRPEYPTADGLTLTNPNAAFQQSMVLSNGVSQATYTMTALYRADKPGEYRLGPIRIAYRSGTGQEGSISTDVMTLEVAEDAPRPPSDIIHAIMPKLWIYILGALILAAGVAFIAWWRSRKKPSGEAPATQTIFVSRTLEQAIVEEIRAVPRPSASDAEAVKAYYDKVDEILRKYLSQAYAITTGDATAWEIRSRIKTKHGKPDSRFEQVMSIINDCDWVKYARCRPDQDDIERIPVRVSDALTGGIDRN